MSATTRLLPLRGELLSISDVRGPWRPCVVDAAAGSALAWGSHYAMLADFDAGSLKALLGQCRQVDAKAFGTLPSPLARPLACI